MCENVFYGLIQYLAFFSIIVCFLKQIFLVFICLNKLEGFIFYFAVVYGKYSKIKLNYAQL